MRFCALMGLGASVFLVGSAVANPTPATLDNTLQAEKWHWGGSGGDWGHNWKRSDDAIQAGKWRGGWGGWHGGGGGWHGGGGGWHGGGGGWGRNWKRADDAVQAEKWRGGWGGWHGGGGGGGRWKRDLADERILYRPYYPWGGWWPSGGGRW